MMQSEYLDSCSQCCALGTRQDCSAIPVLFWYWTYTAKQRNN